MLTEKQKRFCEFYAADPCATKAAEKAGYSPMTARSIAQENLTKPAIQEYLQEIQRESDASRIAQIDEIKAFWTQTMRDTEVRTEFRLRASELLGKAGGAFISKAEVEVKAETHQPRVQIYLPERDPEPE